MSVPVELEQLLDTMSRSGGAALHLLADRSPCLRLQGKLVRSQSGAISRGEMWQLVGELFSEDQHLLLAQGEEVHGTYTTASGESFRSTLMLDERGPGLVFCRVAEQAPVLADLGLPGVVSSFVELRRGLLVLTGFLGSGKSTTLSALLHAITRTRADHVVTVEQPIEHIHTSVAGLVHQREVGRHVATAAAGVRDALALGAEVILVADVASEETWDAVFDAVERGCFVLAGARASSVVGLVEQVAALGGNTPARWLSRLASSLRVLMSQTLLHRSHGTGQQRVPLLEILINNDAVRRALVERRFGDLADIMERSRGLGMQTVDRGLKDLLGEKMVTLDEALYHALDREGLFRRG